MAYVAPLRDIRFVLSELAGLDKVHQLPGGEEAGQEVVDAILDENARLLQDAIAPLNRDGDLQPPVWRDGAVTASPGFAQAFRSFVEGGWQGLQHPVDFGGQGLPKVVATPCMENLNAACLSFALCPLLTDGAIEVLLTAGTEEQKRRFIPSMIDGSWTGTMNLTEPQAGSDLSLVRTRAVAQPDGSYRLHGQKIFITYGEHDMARNIVHMVLARLADAPEGIKGLSLFVVPKFLVNDDGSLGKRNDVWCASIEHKLGIKASPTAVLLYGEDKGEVGPGAIGYLVGEPNRGLETMFIMMNAARFAVGLQGIAVAERASQHAVAYAKDRVQSRAVEGSTGPVAIVHHPDVRRMLLTMRTLTEAARAVAYVAAGAHDFAHRHPDAQMRARNQAFYEYMVPIVKGFSTEMAVEVASLGIQVHGGMGFIEETGAAQYYRDARILSIYEGTTAIQANDLVGRKTARDGGAVAAAIIGHMRETLAELDGDEELSALRGQLADAIQAYEEVVRFVVERYRDDVREVYAGSVPYLMLAGLTHGGWQMARAALACRRRIAKGDVDTFYPAKLAGAQFYCAHLLPRVEALRREILQGGASTLAMPVDAF
ncbi:MAG: acyl-CoA dehydrogenase [Bordetella sp. SCN 67-23]|nr:acyl-CoA dehydrogenase [Burkholderiales bacterium]ODS69578.1 MAG: acyl-CoA dehydrogenase [Bordetella sp. SCN 67-23]ODU80434.1 MAG: acyl-CoA dehydrogenase [Bordetella sp. SCN 68-11]OJW89980.1 MAG: acyl-CoA dehydrogenase [Burkholderiales bacterium 67-32]